jgi:hypothetical protein
MARPDILVITEGAQDDTFFGKLTEAREITGFQVVPPPERKTLPGIPAKLIDTRLSGIDAFASRLQGIITDSNFEFKRRQHLLVVADNDEDATKQFNRVADQVVKAGWKRPSGPRTPTDRAAGSGPKLSVLMLPWENVAGCLETLCYESAAAKRSAFAACVEAFMKCVKATNRPISKLSKTKIRCLFAAACEKDPNTGLNHAWSSDKGRRPDDLVPLDHACFDAIANYLSGLHSSQ